MAVSGAMHAASSWPRRAMSSHSLPPAVMLRRLSTFIGQLPAPEALEAPNTSGARDLAQFLDLQKVNYRLAVAQRQARQWSVVMGNEAGDLDSLASAIAYAWYASTHLRQLTVPLLQVAREDLVLRAENLHALERAGIDPAVLLTADDAPAPSGETYALVDHNRLGARFAYAKPVSQPGSPTLSGSPAASAGFESRVVGIVDHHADEGAHLDAQPRIIEPAGSCASLVTRLLASAPAQPIPRALAVLLLSAIVLDTGALKDGGKALPVDREAADWLLPQAALDSSPPASASFKDTKDAKEKDTQHRALRELHEVLQSKKSAVAHLGARDLLRRDYKEYTYAPSWAPARGVRVGLATVPRGLKGWLADEPGFWGACAAYADERGLDALGVLTTWRDDSRLARGRHRREQAWLVRDAAGRLAERLWVGLERSGALGLKRKDGKRYVCAREGFVGRVYEQSEASATRKVTAPLVKEIIEGPEGGGAR